MSLYKQFNILHQLLTTVTLQLSDMTVVVRDVTYREVARVVNVDSDDTWPSVTRQRQRLRLAAVFISALPERLRTPVCTSDNVT